MRLLTPLASVATLSAIVLSLFTVSCATQRMVSPAASPRVASGVAQSESKLTRLIASVDDEKALEAEFQMILNSDSPAKFIKKHGDDILKVYFVSEGYLRDYDAKVDDVAKHPEKYLENAILTDESYARVMAAWILTERARAQVTYIWYRLQQTIDDTSNTKLQDKALTVQAAFQKWLGTNSGGVNRLAMQGLYHDLIETQTVLRDARIQTALAQQSVGGPTVKTPPAQDAMINSLNRMTFNDGAAIQTYYRANSVGLANAVRANKADPVLSVIVEGVVPELKAEMSANFETRAPQSAGALVPSSGPSGNMTGSSFRQGRWAITFDDGPSNLYTEKILANLQAHDMHASFFWLQMNTPKMPKIVRDVQAAGMVVANHSMSHKNLPKQSEATLQTEIVESTTVATRVYGYKPEFFRCPYGAFGGTGSHIREMIAKLGMIHVLWNVDSLDWQDKNPASVLARVKQQMKVQKKGIILFHDIHPQSEQASRMLMDSLKTDTDAGTTRVLTVKQARDELNSPAGMQ